METLAILAELKRLRSLTHQVPILATEHALDRLIHSIQQDEDELEKEWDSLLRGVTLTSVDVDLTYRFVRE